MRPGGKIAGIENVPRKILYNVDHFKVSLDLPLSLTFQYNYEIVENRVFCLFSRFRQHFCIYFATYET